MYGIVSVKMTHRRLISISRGGYPRRSARGFEQAYAAALLKNLILRQIFGLFFPTELKNTRSIGHPILDERGDVVEFVSFNRRHRTPPRASRPGEGV